MVRDEIIAKPSSMPDSVMLRIRALEDTYPDQKPLLAGGLAGLFDTMTDGDWPNKIGKKTR